MFQLWCSVNWGVRFRLSRAIFAQAILAQAILLKLLPCSRGRRATRCFREFRNERSDKFWWKSVLVDLGWAPGEAIHNTPHVFVCSLCVRL